MVARLERRWQDATGRAHVVACRSGRVALRLAVASLDLSPGDEVVFPADAVELAHAINRNDLVAVPADLDPRTIHIDPEAVEAAITERTQAVVAVDCHGTTADYRVLGAIAARHGLAMVEDGSQSLGATYNHGPVGSHGDVSLCSLTGNDARSSLGTGGLLATDDDTMASVARRMLLVNNEPPEGWTCQLSELDAAVADAQLRQRHDRLVTRCVNGSHLRDRLGSIAGLWVPDTVRTASHVYTSLPMVVVPDELGLPEPTAAVLRDTVIDCLTAEGLWIDRWQPQPFTDTYGFDGAYDAEPGEFPVAEWLMTTGIVLGHQRPPFDPPHTTATMDRIADAFIKVFVDNADRLRRLTEERYNATNMT